MTITVSDAYSIPFQGESDQYIMQPCHLARYTVSQQRDINLVRIYLQVNTLADMSDSNSPNSITTSMLNVLLHGLLRPTLGRTKHLQLDSSNACGKDTSDLLTYATFHTGRSLQSLLLVVNHQRGSLRRYILSQCEASMNISRIFL